MTRRASLYLLLIVGMGVVLNHVSWREKDGRQLWVVNEKEFDVRGIAQDTWNQLTRDCEGVTHVPPQAPQHQAIEKLIQGYSPPGSNSAQIKTLLSNANWALAEVVFDELFPAVVLL